MTRARHDDEVEEWCPYCREHHTGESEAALQDEIQNICAEVDA